MGNAYKEDHRLSPHQTLVLIGIALGLDMPTIARVMGIQTRTVKWHVYDACDRLGVAHKQTIVVLKAIKLGLIKLDDLKREIRPWKSPCLGCVHYRQPVIIKPVLINV